MSKHTFSVTFVSAALALPLLVGGVPASAAPTPSYVWSELTSVMLPMPMPMNPAIDTVAAINEAPAGGYRAILTRAQEDWLDRACTVVLMGSRYSSGTVDFCNVLKDEIDVAEAEDRR
jgi:hypothetical protein